MTFCFAQQYNDIYAQVDPFGGLIEVKQSLHYTNHGSAALDTLYLYDWNHAYSDTSTPLAAKLSEEFNFQFEKSKSDEKGNTKIQEFRTTQGSLNWHRLEKQKDIVAIHLTHPIQPHDSLVFSASYVVKLPADDFTGYGIGNTDEISFRNGFLQFANLGE